MQMPASPPRPAPLQEASRRPSPAAAAAAQARQACAWHSAEGGRASLWSAAPCCTSPLRVEKAQGCALRFRQVVPLLLPFPVRPRMRRVIVQLRCCIDS
eukprot:323293-Chlamydomonas_euryale.AAC.4